MHTNSFQTILGVGNNQQFKYLYILNRAIQCSKFYLFNFRFTRVSSPTGSRGLRLGLKLPLNHNLAYCQLGRLPLNHTLAYHQYGRLPLTWPTSVVKEVRGCLYAGTLPGED